MAEAAVAAPHRVREYETIYVLRPDVAREAQERVAQRLADVVTRENGKLTTVENWGRRQLAYTVAKFRRGVYVYLKYLGGGTLVSEVERTLRLVDDVLKYQTVQTRTDIEFGSVEVSPENVQFESVEPATAEELNEPIERLLGLEQSPERERPSDDVEEDYESDNPVTNDVVAEDRS